MMILMLMPLDVPASCTSAGTKGKSARVSSRLYRWMADLE